MLLCDTSALTPFEPHPLCPVEWPPDHPICPWPRLYVSRQPRVTADGRGRLAQVIVCIIDHVTGDDEQQWLSKIKYKFKSIYCRLIIYRFPYWADLLLCKFGPTNVQWCKLLRALEVQSLYSRFPCFLLDHIPVVCLQKKQWKEIKRLALDGETHSGHYLLQCTLVQSDSSTFCTWDSWVEQEILLCPLWIHHSVCNNQTLWCDCHFQ